MIHNPNHCQVKEDIPEFWARVIEMQDDEDVAVRRQVFRIDDDDDDDGDDDSDGDDDDDDVDVDDDSGLE